MMKNWAAVINEISKIKQKKKVSQIYEEKLGDGYQRNITEEKGHAVHSYEEKRSLFWNV